MQLRPLRTVAPAFCLIVLFLHNAALMWKPCNTKFRNFRVLFSLGMKGLQVKNPGPLAFNMPPLFSINLLKGRHSGGTCFLGFYLTAAVNSAPHTVLCGCVGFKPCLTLQTSPLKMLPALGWGASGPGVGGFHDWRPRVQPTSRGNCTAWVSAQLVVVWRVKHMPSSLWHQGVKLAIAGLNWLIVLRILGWHVPPSEPSQQSTQRTQKHTRCKCLRCVYIGYYKRYWFVWKS